MSTVIIIGHVNYDRVWLLSSPLASGARITYSERNLRLGGGGFHTGGPLVELGHEVRLVSNLMDDDLGHSALAALNGEGFDTRYVTMLPGETSFAEILLEPNGERTILNRSAALKPPFAVSELVTGHAAYLNAIRLDATLVSALQVVPLVISQFPLRPASPRPADIVIGSRADFQGEEVHKLWVRAAEIAGPRLKTLVLTDGPRPISLYDGAELRQVAPLKQVTAPDTIGAGDRFAGFLLHGLLHRLSLEQAAEQASRRTAEWLYQRKPAR